MDAKTQKKLDMAVSLLEDVAVTLNIDSEERKGLMKVLADLDELFDD